MGFFDKAKDLYNMKKQASVIEKELKGVTIDSTSGGVTVICDGKQLFLEAKAAEGATLDPKIAKTFIEAANKAIKKSQEIGAEKMKGVMNGMFGDKKMDMYTLQKQAKDIKEQLKNIHIEAEASGLILTVDGEQQFIDLKGTEQAPLDPALARAFVDASNKAIRKSQLIGAEKMKAVMGNSGMFGQ